MKIKNLKLAQTIRIGSKHPAESFLDDSKFDITMDPKGDMIQIVSKVNGHIAYTTKYNVVYFDLDETAPISPKSVVANVRSEHAARKFEEKDQADKIAEFIESTRPAETTAEEQMKERAKAHAIAQAEAEAMIVAAKGMAVKGK